MGGPGSGRRPGGGKTSSYEKKLSKNYKKALKTGTSSQGIKALRKLAAYRAKHGNA